MTGIATLEATVEAKKSAYDEAAAHYAAKRSVQAEEEYVQAHYRAALSVAEAQGVLLNGPATFAQARESYRELMEGLREIYDAALKDLTAARVALWQAA